MKNYQINKFIHNQKLTGNVTHVVSLGSTCEVAFNIRRYFKAANSYPFDWIGSPLDQMYQILQYGDPKLLIPDSSLIIENKSTSLVSVPSVSWLSTENKCGGPMNPLLGHIFD